MDKLGLHSDTDLALHLPLRYEDETRLTPLAALHEGLSAQVEGVVADCRIELRPRRQLIVRLRDGGDELLLRFLHFHPAQQKSMAPGTRLRARGEVRGGFFGRETVHPAVKAVGEHSPLPQSLTPVYPAGAQLPQAYLRKAIAGALARAPLQELLPPELLPPDLPSLKDALQFLHHPPPDASLDALGDHSHPAWQRLKFEELLAQQLAQAQARQERLHLRAPLALAAAGEPGDAHAQRRQPLHQLLEMLLGQDLGGRHQRTLPAGVDGQRRGQRRDHGLARTDVALQQPVHGLGAR